MSRKPRLYYPGALYHVIARGNAKQSIFSEDADRHQYQRYIAEGLSEHGHRIHAYCWMGNHIHMLIQAGDTPISRMMQIISQRYTQWFNHKYERVGHLFQGRYKALLVDADEYLLELVRYIHLNPLRAGLVDTPDHYPWSSHLAYLGTVKTPWLTTDWVLQQFGEEPQVARAAYQRFLGQKSDQTKLDTLSSGCAEGRVLGSDTFIRKVTEARNEISRPILDCSLDEIVTVIAEETGVSAEELISPSQRRLATQARAMIALIAVDHACLTVTEVANHLSRHPTVLSRQLKQTRERVARHQLEKEKVARYIISLNSQA